jgi:hypothetical protein
MAYDSDLFKDFKIIKRKPLNIINNLIGRELGTYSSLLHISSNFSEYSNKNQQTKFNHLKCLYLCVTPNYTILNVKTPSCFIRKFSLNYGFYDFIFSFTFCITSLFYFLYSIEIEYESESSYYNFLNNESLFKLTGISNGKEFNYFKELSDPVKFFS